MCGQERAVKIWDRERCAGTFYSYVLGNTNDVKRGWVPSVQGGEGRRQDSDGYDDSVSDISCEAGCVQQRYKVNTRPSCLRSQKTLNIFGCVFFNEFKPKVYVVRTVHFGMKLFNDQRNAQVFNLCIYLLLPYMFRAFF
jgi:hypothetical protein